MIKRKRHYALKRKQKPSIFSNRRLVFSACAAVTLIAAIGITTLPGIAPVSLLNLEGIINSTDTVAETTPPSADTSQDKPAETDPTTSQQPPASPDTPGTDSQAAPTDPSLQEMPKASVTRGSMARFSTKQLYAYTLGDPALQQANEWRTLRPADAARMDLLAQTPKARWLGNWNGDIYSAATNYLSAAAVTNKVPVIVAYNIPNRHCSNEPGGAATPAAYKTWIDDLARALKIYPGIVILEPDALGLVSCLSVPDQEARYDLIRYASKTLSATGSAVYLDASHWVAVDGMAERLKLGGIEYAAGFSLNVANYNDTASMKTYGEELSAATGGKHYVIDTGRNGQGSNSEWCNALGRSVGELPRIVQNSKLDAYLWIKYPGESDGACNGGPTAGQWWADYAVDLLVKAGY